MPPAHRFPLAHTAEIEPATTATRKPIDSEPFNSTPMSTEGAWFDYKPPNDEVVAQDSYKFLQVWDREVLRYLRQDGQPLDDMEEAGCICVGTLQGTSRMVVATVDFQGGALVTHPSGAPKVTFHALPCTKQMTLCSREDLKAVINSPAPVLEVHHTGRVDFEDKWGADNETVAKHTYRRIATWCTLKAGRRNLVNRVDRDEVEAMEGWQG